MDRDDFKDFDINRESRNKRLFVEFLRSILEYTNKSKDRPETYIFEEILFLLERKSVENFLYFRMLFDLVINDQSINKDKLNRRKLIESARKSIKKSKRKNYFIKYIETYDLTDIIYKFIEFRNIISNQSKNLNNYDIFLSHKYTNKFYNFTLYFVLKYIYRLNVYVDWIENPNLNRKKVSKQTINVLSKALKKSKYLLFFNLNDNSTTTWMAWEVGYFKGLNKRVGIMDLGDYLKGRSNVEKLSSNEVFKVNNYLGIYEMKTLERISEFIKTI